MTTSLWLMDSGFLAVRDSAYDTQDDTATWQRIAVYDETAYPVIHQTLSDNVKNATWANGQLTINGQVVIDSAWIAARQAEITQAGNVASAKTGLLDKIDLAKTHATTIRTLFNAVLDQTINQIAQPTRFDALKAVIQNAPLAFRERLITDCIQELGFDPTGTLSAAQIRQATLYVRMWITGLALLLSVA
jgi:hypothetical protein